MRIGYLILIYALTLIGPEIHAQTGWTKKQLTDFKNRLNMDCHYSNAFCDCVFEGVTSSFRAKEVSFVENQSAIQAITEKCQSLHNSFPIQVIEPELQITSFSVKDVALQDKGIRFDSRGFLVIGISNKPDVSRDGNVGNISNQNDRIAYGCVLNIGANIQGLHFERLKYDLGNISWGETKMLEIPYQTDTTLRSSGQLSIPVSVRTWNENSKYSIEAKPGVMGFVPSDVSYEWETNPQGEHSWNLKLRLFNQGFGAAEDVKVSWTALKGVNLTTNSDTENFSELASGEKANEIPITYRQKVDQELGEILLTIQSKYSSPTYDTLRFNFNKRESNVAVISGDFIANRNQYSRVDELPKIKKPQEFQNRIGLVIGIEQYKSLDVASVPYALHDAEVVYTYFNEVLGIPERNLFKLTDDPTRAEILTTLDKINKQKDVMANGLGSNDIDVFFYYAGHGTGNNFSEPVLVPFDVSLLDIDAAIPREDIINSLALRTSGSVIAFIDACYAGNSFSVGDRGIGVKPRGNISDNVVIFSAVTGSEKAYPNSPEAHGAFTFELLSLLKKSEGRIALGELEKELIQNVFHSTNRKQTPSVIFESEKWKEWTLLED